MTIVSHESYIVDAVRTPIGRIGGALAGVRPDDLAATAVRALAERSPDLDPSAIDEAYLGDANQAGEDNRNVARMAVLLAGLPTTIPGATVNRLCGSGLEAVIAASRAVSVGDADVVIAGGVESMSRAPWVLQKPAKGYPTGHEQLWSTTLGWRMTNPKMPDAWTVSLGEGAELLADKYSISREEQDVFAHGSHQRADAAWNAGHFAAEIVPVAGLEPGLDRDECIRADTTIEKLAGLRTVFRASGGTVTAGNASPMNDGSAALLVTSHAGLARTGREPIARIRAGPRAGSIRISTASGRSRPPATRCAGPASTGATCRASSSTRRSPRRAWRACASGPSSIPRSSTRSAGRSRSVIRSVLRCPHPHHARAPSRPHRRPLRHGGDVHRRRPGHRRRRREPALNGTSRTARGVGC